MEKDKTYITYYQRQIVLNSSIIDKPEYLNLKYLLEKYDKVSQSTLDEELSVDEITKDIVIHAFNDIFISAREEWVAIGNNDTGKVKCSLCNEPNTLIFYIQNTENHKILNVGSSCILHFPNCKKMTNGTSINSVISKSHKNYDIIRRKVDFDKEYSNLDDLIQKYTSLLKNAPILLNQEIYQKLSEKISAIKNFMTRYLNGKLERDSLFELHNTIDDCDDLYDNIIPAWIELHKNDQFICTVEMKDWLISNKYDDIVDKLRTENSIFTKHTLPYLAYEPFIQQILPEMKKQLLNNFLSIELYEHKIFVVFNNRKLMDIPFWCSPKIFMQNFADSLLTDDFEIPSLKSCLEFLTLDAENISYIYILLRRLTRQFSDYNFLYDNITKQLYIISSSRSEFFTMRLSILVKRFIPHFVRDPDETYTENHYFKYITGWKSVDYLENKKVKQLYEDNHGEEYVI